MRMHSFTHADGWSSDEAWAWFSVGRDMRDALDALDTAAGLIVMLAEGSAWHSDGLRALHEAIIRMQMGVRALRPALVLREAEIERAAAS